MQWLDRERHACRPRVFEQFADAIAHHLARADQVLRHDAPIAVSGKTADHQNQAGRVKR